MSSRLRTLAVPAYLFACLILGGSIQGIWQVMILQLLGIALITWSAWSGTDEPLARPARLLLYLAIAAILVVLLQMIALPPAVWTHLGPRGRIAGNFQALGIRVPPEPLSLTPASGLEALLAIIPPLAVFCAMVRLKGYRPTWLAIALISAALPGIALGALQVGSSTAQLSPWYLYEETSNGRAAGFFANADHMAILLVITIPFLTALVAAAKTASMQRYSAILAVCIGIGFVFIVGLALNGSLAGYGLALPVIAASALIVIRKGRLRLWIVAIALILVVAAVTALETTAIGGGRLGAHAANATQSRVDLVSTTAQATADFMPFGSGFGSFENVYHLYENPQHVTDTYVVHAHNDYLEFALELGVAGIILMLLFLAWWAVAVWRAWRTAEAGPFARAATIASAAILIHSLVEFPLRTPALAACFAMCIALLADRRAAPLREKRELRRKRHVEFM